MVCICLIPALLGPSVDCVPVWEYCYVQLPGSIVCNYADTNSSTAVANPGWWDGLLVTDIVGCKYYQSSQTGQQAKLIETVTTGGITFLSLCPWAWAAILGHPLGIAFGHPVRVWTLWIGAILREFLIMAAWFTTLVLMSVPKHKDFRNMFTEPPYGAWNVGITMAVLEM